MGVDGAGDGDLTVTFAADGEEPRVYSAQGGSLSEAARKMRMMPEGRETLLAHTENLLISEKTARSGIDGILDYVVRAAEMRIDTDIFIVKGTDAAGLLLRAGEDGDSVSDMLRFLKRGGEGVSFRTNCRETVSSLLKNGSALVSAVCLRRSGDISGGEERFSAAGAGLAVIKAGKLAYFLTESESRGAVLIKNRFEFAPLTLSVEGGRASLDVTEAKTDIVPEYGEDGSLKSLLVRLHLSANVSQAEGVSPDDENVLLALRRAAEERAKRDVRNALSRAKRTGTDFLGIGETLKRKAPVRFSAAEAEWEELFRNLPVRAEADFEIQRTYDLIRPAVGKGETYGAER